MENPDVSTRRARLAQWVAKYGVPPNERSYFSQLARDASFGEKVARRLEKQYGMPHKFLDTPIEDQVQLESPLAAALTTTAKTPEETMMLVVHRLASPEDRAALDFLVETIRISLKMSKTGH
jgi:hypothetical protein